MILLVLGVDTVMARKAAVDLRRFTNELCRSTAVSSITPTEAAYSFSQRLNALTYDSQTGQSLTSDLIPNVQITAAHLIIPTYDPAISGEDQSIVETPRSFTELGIEKCNGINDGGDCVFHGNVSLTSGDDVSTSYVDEFLNGRFPASPEFWSGQKDQSIAIGCEVHGKVTGLYFLNRLMGGSEISSLQSRAVMAKTLRNVAGVPVHGLTVAIAPQMTTEAADPRFRFSSAADNLGGEFLYEFGYNEDFLERYDPLLWFNHHADADDPASLVVPAPYTGRSAVPAFLKESTYQSYTHHQPAGCNPLQSPCLVKLYRTNAMSSTKNYVPPASSTPKAGSVEVSDRAIIQANGQPTSNFFVQDHPLANPIDHGLVLSQREERLASCMNPLILVRNQFLATVVQLASRTGSLRNATSLYLVPPYDRDIDTIGMMPNGKNFPVNLNAFSTPAESGAPRDLTNATFQLPFVVYRSPKDFAGIVGYEPQFVPVPIVNETYGVVSPFPQFGQTPNQHQLQHHALLAEQLRECYMLYRNSYTTPQGINFRGIHLPSLSPFIGNLGFTDSENSSGSYDWPLAGLANVLPNRLLNLHAKAYPWIPPNVPANPNPPSPSEGWQDGNRFLNGAEVVGMIGSIQRAPAINAFKIDFGPSYRVAAKPPQPEPGAIAPLPNTPSLDLKPDLIGLLTALGNSEEGWIKNSPGLALTITLAVNAPVQVENSTHVLLVLHTRLFPKEAETIFTAFKQPENKGLRNRRMTIVYMPANAIDASNGAIKLLRKAFYIDTNIVKDVGDPADDEGVDDRFRQLIVFSPYDQKYAGLLGVIPGAASNIWVPYQDSQLFAKFWAYLLSENNPERNIRTAAHQFMKDQVFANGVKF